MVTLGKLEQKVLEIIQQNFPIVSHPYEEIARQLGSTEDEVFNSVQSLCRKGVIRRLGGSFDSRKLGYKSTLVALSVPESRLDKVVAVVNNYPEVTHNYEREGTFNIWFTLIAQSDEAIDKIIEDMKSKTGVPAMSLPATHIFKIKVDFDLGDNDE